MNSALLDIIEDMGAEVEDTLERLMDDEELYLEYLEQLPENENILELRDAVDAGDCSKAEKEVHTLKGIALNLGLLPLADVCMDMLMDLREGRKEEGLGLINEVEEEFNRWANAIKENR